MVSVPRAEGSTAVRDSVPLSLRKIPLWTQEDPILDVAVLEENAAPTQIAVLDQERRLRCTGCRAENGSRNRR